MRTMREPGATRQLALWQAEAARQPPWTRGFAVEVRVSLPRDAAFCTAIATWAPCSRSETRFERTRLLQQLQRATRLVSARWHSGR